MLKTFCEFLFGTLKHDKEEGSEKSTMSDVKKGEHLSIIVMSKKE